MADTDLIQIVDENDNPTGSATRKEAQDQGLFHRVVRITVEDKNGNVLLQRRGSSVKLNPNYWDNAVAGHVDFGEDYDTTAERELEEEIGLTGYPIEKIDYYYIDSPYGDGKFRKVFATVYRVIIEKDTPLELQESEVGEMKWFTRAEPDALVSEDSDHITPGLMYSYEKFYSV